MRRQQAVLKSLETVQTIQNVQRVEELEEELEKMIGKFWRVGSLFSTGTATVE
jgi:hypothetical protein